MTDEIFMREALRTARNAEGRTSPNPLVGAVVVREGKIVAAGWHRQAGTPHAEIHALNILVADEGTFRVELLNSAAHLYTA